MTRRLCITAMLAAAALCRASHAVVPAATGGSGTFQTEQPAAAERAMQDLMRSADMVRAVLAGSLRTYPLLTCHDTTQQLQAIDNAGQPAGFAIQPGEAGHYGDNGESLFDTVARKLPLATGTEDRTRVQILGAAIVAFSQGADYLQAGTDSPRPVSHERARFSTSDWFNRIEWSYQDHDYGSGAMLAEPRDPALLKPVLARPALKPRPVDITFARDAARDLLRIRASSTLFRMRKSEDILRRLRFFNTGSKQEPTVIAAHLDGQGYAGAGFSGLSYFINADKVAHVVTDPGATGKRMLLHPVHNGPDAADKRAVNAGYDSFTGTFSIPPRTAVVFVEETVREPRRQPASTAAGAPPHRHGARAPAREKPGRK